MSQRSLDAMMTYGRGEVSAGLPRTVPLPRVADRPGANRGGTVPAVNSGARLPC